MVLFDESNSTGAIDVKMDGSVLEEKLSFKMLGLASSSKFDWSSYIIFITETASKKIGALIDSMKFLSPEVALYLYEPTIQPCVEYYCYVWAGAPSYHPWNCSINYKNRYVGLLVLHLLPLLNPWLIVEM